MTIMNVLATQQPCPACAAKRFHADEEWKQYHPNAGKGKDLRKAPHK